MGKHKKKFLHAQIFGSTVSVLASGVAILGMAAAPVTGGASLIPAYVACAATGIAWFGSMTSSLASLMESVLETEGIDVCNPLHQILKAPNMNPGQRLKLVSKVFKDVIRAAERGGPRISAVATVCKTANNVDRVRKLKKITGMIDYVRKSPFAKLNGLSMLVSVVDLITASVQLYKMENSS